MVKIQCNRKPSIWGETDFLKKNKMWVGYIKPLHGSLVEEEEWNSIKLKRFTSVSVRQFFSIVFSWALRKRRDFISGWGFFPVFLPKIVASNAFSQEFLFSLRKGFSFFLLTNDRNIHFFSSQIIELFIFLLTNNRDIPVFLVLLSLVKRSLLLLHGDLNKFPGNLKNLEIRPQILGFDSLYN